MVPLSFWAWLVVAAVCATYELWGAQMLSLSFALGALAAAVACSLGAGGWWPWGLFFGVSLFGIATLGRWGLRAGSPP